MGIVLRGLAVFSYCSSFHCLFHLQSINPITKINTLWLSLESTLINCFSFHSGSMFRLTHKAMLFTWRLIPKLLNLILNLHFFPPHIPKIIFVEVFWQSILKISILE